jgi:hypothetical protein
MMHAAIDLAQCRRMTGRDKESWLGKRRLAFK